MKKNIHLNTKVNCQLSIVNCSKGFTLIEILVVFGLLAILLTITLIAINPQRQFTQARDLKRRGDVHTILNAISQYATDNAGRYPSQIDISPKFVATGPGNADICADLVSRYVAALPHDPFVAGDKTTDCSVAYNTGYSVYRITSGSDIRITVFAANSELVPTISVTR